MSTPEAVVRQFCDAVAKRDPELIRPLLTDDVVYMNVGMPATTGLEAVIANVQGQWEMFTGVYEFQIRHLASVGDVVLTERVDVVGTEGRSMPVPLMGAFEVHDGKIACWRDYFDSGLIAKMMGGEDVSGLVP
jgi:limonene-1,2-epoxide hydrolase